jgi:hypothetical protein
MTSQQKSKKMNPILSLLWWCAGVTPNLLKEWPTEWSKYTTIGFSVLTTALLAAISSAYAVYIVFKSYWPAIIIGVVWSLIILNLNRLIVSTLSTPSKGGSQLAVFTELLLKALPRFLLAIAIAVVISKPLEIVLFQKEIQEQIYQQHSAALETTKQLIAVRETEIANLNESLKFESQRLSKLSEAYFKELDGTGGTGRSGLGPVSRERLDQLRLAEKEFKAERDRIEEGLIQKTSELAALKSQEEDLARTLQSAQSSFLSRFETLANLAKSDRRIMLTNFFIVVLILLLEVSPILIKLWTPKGPYDEVQSRADAVFNNEISQSATQLDLKLREALSEALDKSFLKHRQQS